MQLEVDEDFSKLTFETTGSVDGEFAVDEAASLTADDAADHTGLPMLVLFVS